MINTIMQNRNINNVTVESFNGLLVSFVKKKILFYLKMLLIALDQS